MPLIEGLVSQYWLHIGLRSQGHPTLGVCLPLGVLLLMPATVCLLAVVLFGYDAQGSLEISFTFWKLTNALKSVF